MSVTTEILDVRGENALTVVHAGDDLWVETCAWRLAVEDIVDAALNRVSVLEMRKVLATEAETVAQLA